MVLEGKDPNEMATELSALANKVEFSFIIDQLTFLRKGGRCSSLSALGANLLKLKPSIGVNKTGTLAVDKKYRGTFEKVLPFFLEDHLSERHSIVPEKTMLVTTSCPPEWEELAIHEVEKHTGHVIEDLFNAGCTICSHSGPKALGLVVLKK